MKVVASFLLIALGLGCAAAETAPSVQSAPSQGPAQTQDAVVAEMADRRITLKEVDDRWQAMDPAERARVTQMLYQNRRNVLDQMVGDVLIEEAAKAAGKSVLEYQKQELATRQRAVTDADIKQFYEENKDRAQGRPLEQLTGPIREFLVNQRMQQARAQLVDDLKKKSPARILLDPPRQTVEVAADDPAMGPPTAAITLVEFSDYQ